MKKAIFAILFLFVLFQLEAQTFTYTYTYDGSGNRTKRVCVQVKDLEGPSIFDSQAGRLKESYTAGESLDEYVDNRVITLYPNPTRGEIVLRIEPLPEGVTGRITVIGTDGRLCLEIMQLSEYNDLDMTGLSSGSYILLLEMNGKESSYQLIKE
jgi:hypothetical protein